jgi:1,4-dihydroxy-2-naphthoate octaprenyltransferase
VVLIPFVVAASLAASRPAAPLAWLALPLAIPPVRRVFAGEQGKGLIAVLGATGRLQLAFGALLAIGIAV